MGGTESGQSGNLPFAGISHSQSHLFDKKKLFWPFELRDLKALKGSPPISKLVRLLFVSFR